MFESLRACHPPGRIGGGAGNDLPIGGLGDDRLRTADGVSGNDTCIADVCDTVYGCDTVLTS